MGVERAMGNRRARTTTLKLQHPEDVYNELPLSQLNRPTDRDDWMYCVEITDNYESITEKVIPANSSSPLNERQQQKMVATLQRYSTIASWLCLIDCTILPILTVVIPLLGLANLGRERLQMLHTIGDFTTLYMLLPLGGSSIALNFALSRRKRPWIAGLGVAGLSLVALANSYSLPGIGHLEIFHFAHQGMWHRIVNAMGCFCLLISNQLSGQYQHSLQGNTKKEEDSCCILHDGIKSSKTTGDVHRQSRRRRRRPPLLNDVTV
ncbi:MerC mercury resistance protein [Nitzschia inconspicua]|uniref:MerC mercury resistance protein n=1 Tax=Nitzschia inconspicua TaxID=303405 RepID=A0A9K3PVX1_9STRA|nr:MerC mercury resistance protein [Nitzschia inconspicua]